MPEVLVLVKKLWLVQLRLWIGWVEIVLKGSKRIRQGGATRTGVEIGWMQSRRRRCQGSQPIGLGAALLNHRFEVVKLFTKGTNNYSRAGLCQKLALVAHKALRIAICSNKIKAVHDHLKTHNYVSGHFSVGRLLKARFALNAWASFLYWFVNLLDKSVSCAITYLLGQLQKLYSANT